MRLRTRIFLVFILMMGLGVFALVYWIQGDMRPRYMEAQEDTLVDFAQLLASMVGAQGVIVAGEGGSPRIDPGLLESAMRMLRTRDISAQIYGLLKENVDIRIYVTDGAGTVLYDSEQRDLGADYSQWRDVHLTLNGQYGARSTEADPMFPEGSTMYIAAPIRYRGDIVGVLSVGKPTRNAERFMRGAIRKLSVAALWAVLAATLVGLVLHAWISRPLQQLHDYAHDVREGKRKPLPVLGKNEIGMVGAAMEEMRVALEGKQYVNQYVQALTHELKSPLAAVRGAAELLGEDMPDADRARFLNNIREQVGYMQSMIERLLELASIENRRSLEQAVPIELHAVLNAVEAELQPMAESAQVKVHIALAGAPVLTGDPLLLKLALTNLLKNAIEFSAPGGEIKILAAANEGGVCIDIVDHGEGIPHYAQEKVLQRFYSLARKNGRKGTGLGLSIVQEIVDLFHGRFSLESTPGSGTRARLMLPILG